MDSLLGFQTTVMSYFRQNYRDMPWRYSEDPYKILISEIMLQQTQVERVIPKYLAFVSAFPTVQDLAQATPTEVLSHWQGLGYNRRGLFLRKAAEMIVKEYNGFIPPDVAKVDAFPGVGYATACAVVTYSFNLPTVFIETNIRTVFISHFFPEQVNVDDDDILPLVEQALDRENPRDWYYALMDYGVMLKKQRGNASRKSKHYAKQSRFAGSDRQLRGAFVRYLLREGSSNFEGLAALDADRAKVSRVVGNMVKDRTISIKQDRYAIVEK
jgi:A/G-specific adenine glycosylase